MKEWVETTFDGDPMEAVKRVMSSKSSGQLVLNLSQGTVCSVTWRERQGSTVPVSDAPAKNCLDSAPAS
jgi:hypothetical protein